MKAAIYTLGCKVNQYDSQNIAECLKQNGYQMTDAEDSADVYVINTCAVTNESERKSRQTIRRFKHLHPDSIVVVTGCFSETNENAAKQIAEADIVTGTHNRMQIPAFIEEYKKDRIKIVRIENADETVPLTVSMENRARAMLKIQDGCNRYCSYCIIPYARGSLWSADASDVIRVIRALCEQNCKEVVLTGIHLASYRDRKGTDLIALMERIDAETDLPRLRLGSLEPKLLQTEFLHRLKKVGCFCPHFHVSLQSGDDTVLNRMKRRYTTREYAVIADEIRTVFPHAMLTTDVIVGFPGETEEMFANTLRFLGTMRFSHVHVFPFSPKQRTPAADFSDQISRKIKHARVRALMDSSQSITEEIHREQIGHVFRVLTETQGADGLWFGYTENYLPIRFSGGEDLENQIVSVKVRSIDCGILYGEMCKST